MSRRFLSKRFGESVRSAFLGITVRSERFWSPVMVSSNAVYLVRSLGLKCVSRPLKEKSLFNIFFIRCFRYQMGQLKGAHKRILIKLLIYHHTSHLFLGVRCTTLLK